MKVLMPKPLNHPRTEPDVSECENYIKFLRRMQKIKIPRKDTESAQLAVEALSAAEFLARCHMRVDDLGASQYTADVEIMAALQEYAKTFGEM